MVKLLGVYLHLGDGTALADVQVCLLEEGSTGKAVWRAAGSEDQGPVSALISRVPPQAFTDMVQALHGKPGKQRTA